MRGIFALLLALLAGPVAAQQPNLTHLPSNVVVGRLGAGMPGPAQAIPFTTLGSQLSITAAIGVGTTPVSGGTTGDCLYDNAGVVGNQACGSGGGSGITIGTTTITSGTTGDCLYDNSGVVGVQTCGPVASVSNSDSTLTVSPTTGTVVASLNLANANTWSATQTFSNIIGSALAGAGTQCVEVDNTGKLIGTGAGCGGSGDVNSVANSDSTLTISPTSGNVVASLALGHANTWTATQTFAHIIDSDLISAGTQCVEATTSGELAGTGTACGSGSSAVSSVSNSDSTLTISPTTGAVVGSLNLGHANTWTADQTFTHVKFTATAGDGLNDVSSVLGSQTTFWTSSGAALIHRMNRAFVGDDGTMGTGASSSDWLSSLVSCTVVCANLNVFGGSVIAVLGASRASDAVAFFGSASGGSAGAYFFGYNDDTTNNPGSIALGSNGIGIAKVGNHGITLGAQNDMDSAATTCVPAVGTPLCSGGGTPVTISQLLTSGAFSAIATKNITAFLEMGAGYGGGPTGNAGLLIQDSSVTANAGPTLPGVGTAATLGIVIPETYDIVWESSGGSVGAAIFTGGSGSLNFSVSNTIVINGTAAATCPSGISTTAKFIDGLIVSCS